MAVDPYALGSGTIGSFATAENNFTVCLILESDDAENNVVGRGFSYIPGSSETAQAGGAMQDDTPFAGYLVDSKVYANRGTLSGLYDPSIVLPNGTQAQLSTQGTIYVYVTGTVDPAIGYNIWVNIVDGTLTAQPPSVTSNPGYRWGFAKVLQGGVISVGSNGPNAVIAADPRMTLPGLN